MASSADRCFGSAPLRPDFAEWEVILDAVQAGCRLRAHAEDAAGNVEKLPHIVSVW
jgi:hypothetical protein